MNQTKGKGKGKAEAAAAFPRFAIALPGPLYTSFYPPPSLPYLAVLATEAC